MYQNGYPNRGRETSKIQEKSTCDSRGPLWSPHGEPKATKMEPKGAQSYQNGAQGCQNDSPRTPEQPKIEVFEIKKWSKKGSSDAKNEPYHIGEDKRSWRGGGVGRSQMDNTNWYTRYRIAPKAAAEPNVAHSL